ncbi:unnamed protein product, partial [Trichobilharzia szidati]
GVGLLVLLLFVFVSRIRSRPIGVYVVFSIVIVLWSVGFAAFLSPVGLKAGLISLACILVVEIPIVALAMLMPRLNPLGVIVFDTVTLTLAIVVLVLSVFYVFSKQDIILALVVFFCALFILF